MLLQAYKKTLLKPIIETYPKIGKFLLGKTIEETKKVA